MVVFNWILNIFKWILKQVKRFLGTDLGLSSLFIAIIVLSAYLFIFQYLKITDITAINPNLTFICIGAVQLASILAMLLSIKIHRRSIIQIFGLNILKAKGYFALIIKGFILTTISAISVSFLPHETQQTITSVIVVDYRILFVTLCVIAPVLEEVFFRGLLQNAISSKLGNIAGVIIVAILFVAGHPAVYVSMIALVNLSVLALTFGYMKYKTKSIIPSIILHMINNSLALLCGGF